MIHVCDQDFKDKAEEAFHEAYMTHTSTSPNYQILASLDVGRRQVELEGYELVQRQLELAMTLREQVLNHPLLKQVLPLPARQRPGPGRVPRVGGRDATTTPRPAGTTWRRPGARTSSRSTRRAPRCPSARTGIDGDTFKNKYLMDKYGIQINKTSRNTVLFMTNIGTTRSAVAYLIEVLVKIARDVDRARRRHERDRAAHPRQARALADAGAAAAAGLLVASTPAFRVSSGEAGADPRRRHPHAPSSCPTTTPTASTSAWTEAAEAIEAGRELVSALFVIPYPPGFPILVPGQVISAEILQFMRALDVREIHGFRPELGFRVFTDAALARVGEATAARAAHGRGRARRLPGRTQLADRLAAGRPRRSKSLRRPPPRGSNHEHATKSRASPT